MPVVAVIIGCVLGWYVYTSEAHHKQLAEMCEQINGDMVKTSEGRDVCLKDKAVIE